MNGSTSISLKTIDITVTCTSIVRHLKQRKKRGHGYDRRGRLANIQSIDLRPTVVDRRRRLGDWEVDTILGTRKGPRFYNLFPAGLPSGPFCSILREQDTTIAVRETVELEPRASLPLFIRSCPNDHVDLDRPLLEQ